MNLDTTTASVIIIGIFALVVIIGFFLYRKSGNAEIKGPFGTGVKFDGKNNSSNSGGIKAKGLKSQEGGISADDATGKGIEIVNANAKDDIILSSRNTNETVNTSVPGYGQLTAQGISAGGDITIQQFVGGGASLEQQLAFFMQNIGIVKPNNDYSKSQFKAYTEVWRKLQSLRVAGDNLWNRANEDNVLDLAQKLREVKTLVREEEIFFEENDRISLMNVLDNFSKYKYEKTSLINMQEWHLGKERYSVEKIKEQILRNSQLKHQYEDILDSIRKSFRKKLSSQ